ncbi:MULTISPECIES: AI-2E family transporter [unclassified Massilia]|uniref:AI-2E family transporter n=1 Tax=unclassified Massilia TaxID=2609279 RepID=UPI001B83CEDE|nr:MULTISPECIES: AI-2E family transporter [unclassified Massilia]MBQ5941709.1 AI-2E family transporter [Massilia sp. AB1]MBQ5962880.1 AI-2E family transporter [Massilia sp. ZL223]
MQLAKSDPASPTPAPLPAPTPDEAAPDAHPDGQQPPHAEEDLALHAGGLRLPVHVNARGLSLGILATIACVFALQWAQKFFVPLLLGILIAYTLNPVVLWFERMHVRRIVGATLVTAVIVALMAGTIYRLQDEFFNIIDELPTLTHKITKILTNNPGGQRSTIQQVQAAAAEIERAANNVGSDTRRAAPKRQSQLPAAAAGSNIRVMDWVLAGSVGLATFLSQATMVVFLVFFLLLAGDTFKRKLVKLTGPSLTRKKVTVHILDDINTSIQNYMFMLLVTNVLLALLMWGALRAIGLENAGAWAAFSGVAHLMPYFGPLLITAATGMVAFLQFESLRMVILVAGASLGIATLVGMVVATWMTGKIAKMNPAAVFVSLLFWGWLWGVWGLLLGVPVVMVLKVVAERVEGMEWLAELLGE